jgi:cellulose synthase/poly-beta-1,6-N-acetylglucosamine synthase-like glycosyltransferase
MQETLTETAALPLVSLVMPIRNEGLFIAAALGAALAQDYPAHLLEVIVADGMSTDATRQVVRRLQAADPRVRLIDNEGQFVATGLNAALRAARGEIIARVDGHCVIAPDYVRQCVRCLREEQVDCVGGPIETVGETYVARTIALAMSSRFGVGGATFRTVNDRRMLVESLAFPAFQRRAVECAGFFDEELVRNQDDEYNYRLVALGGRILLAPEIRSRYYSRSSLRSLWRQYFQYGYWKVRVMQKHFAQMRLRQFIPAAFVATLLLALLAAPFTRLGLGFFAGLLGLYLCATVLATVWTCGSTGKWRLLPLLPLAFAILHFAYGCGFLTGLVKFWNRWGDRRTHAPWKPQGISALRN